MVPAPPQQIEFARLNLTHTVMSKRLLKVWWMMVWLKVGTTRGCQPSPDCDEEVIRRKPFGILRPIGVAKSNSVVDMGLLEHCVREDLKDKVQSRNVVENPIRVLITNYPEDMLEDVEMENNRNVPEMGNRMVPFGREIFIDGTIFRKNRSRDISDCTPETKFV